MYKWRQNEYPVLMISVIDVWFHWLILVGKKNMQAVLQGEGGGERVCVPLLSLWRLLSGMQEKLIQLVKSFTFWSIQQAHCYPSFEYYFIENHTVYKGTLFVFFKSLNGEKKVFRAILNKSKDFMKGFDNILVPCDIPSIVY